MKHIIPGDAESIRNGMVYARCGERVDRVRDGARPEDATCPDCLRLDAEDAETLKAMEDDDLIQRQADYGVGH